MSTDTRTRRERQREATYDEIVRTSRDLLAEGAELSLRAVASRMGITAPALYRYVSNYQDLIDLVSFELDRQATAEFAALAEKQPADDPAARLTMACIGFRRWALARPREFALVFANPLASAESERRELVTVSTSGRYLTDLLYEVWKRYQHPIPSLEELDPVVRESVLDPVIPARCEQIPPEHRGLLWIYMRAWTALYGVVTLEASGHCDPRVLKSGALFRAMMLDWTEPLGLAGEHERLATLLDAELTVDRDG